MKKIGRDIISLIGSASFVLISFVANAETITHSYDDLNRLIKSEYSDGTVLIYEYDELGNRIYKRKLYKPHSLTILKTGAGTGVIVSSPPRINCGPVCAEKFNEGTPITLTVTPAVDSLFVQWSGVACPGTGPCVVTMNSDTTISAVFQPTGSAVFPSCSNLAVKTSTGFYSTLQSAYNAAQDGTVIRVQAVTLVEDFRADRNITVTIDGGYSCDYLQKTGVTTVNGTVTTDSGKITIGDFVVKN